MSTHQRDGSLLRKKQDQWARERAEESENIWFPFGSPGGGTPNRKFESINYTSPPLARNDVQESLSEDRPTSCTRKDSINSDPRTQQDSNVRTMRDAENRTHGQPKVPQGSSFLPHQLQMAYPIPFQCSYPAGFPSSAGPNGMPWSYLQPIPINCVPAGTIPIPIQDLSRSIAEGTPICPVTIAEQLAQMASQNACWGPAPPTNVPVAIPIPSSVAHRAPIDPDQEPHTSNVAVVPPLEQSGHEGYESSSCSRGTMSRRSTVDSKYDSDRRSSVTDYDEQIAEKKRVEAEEAERDRYEEEKVEREKEEKARREAELDRKHREEERLKEQEKERVRQTLEEALERAKREAEITRKARVFKHVLEGAEKSPELERRLLGVDPETGDRILQEISQLERHKKLDQETIYKKSAKSGRNDSRDTSPAGARSKSAQPKSRSQSMSESMMKAELGADRRRTCSGTKQTASIRPFNSVDDAVKSALMGREMRQQSTDTFTPLRRGLGRMSMRITKKEKENSPTDDFKRNTVRSLNKSTENTSHPSLRDQGMPTSKIPIPKPILSATKSGPRPVTLPPQPLRHANNLPDPETEPVHYAKGHPSALPRPNCLPPSKELVDNPLFSPVATRHRRFNRMRGLSDSPVNVDYAGSSGSTEESNEGNSSGSVSPQEAAPSPVPAATINNGVYTTPKSILTSNNNELKIRSALSSPLSYLGPSPRSSSYTMKLMEKGCNMHVEDTLSPDVRRRAEANLSRAPSVQSLRGSIGNLAGWRGSISNLAEDAKPNLSRFRSMNPSYRSFNAKRTTEKQQEVIERLSRLRENLRSRENFVERGTLSKQPSNLTSGPAVIKT